MSRFRRADYNEKFDESGRNNVLLDFRSRFLTYTSSWRQSVEAYSKLKNAFSEKIYLIYYEDFCSEFESEVRSLSGFLQVPFSKNVLKWHELPHHNAKGELVRNLKYPDSPIFTDLHNQKEIPPELLTAISTIHWQYQCYKKRGL
jgi:hypothetical protein